MGPVASTQIVQPRYDEEAPGLWCPSHRSVFCSDVQAWIENRNDAESLAEVIGGNINRKFFVSFPIYPSFCVWLTLPYMGVNHEMLGPMAECQSAGERFRVIARLMPGEGAADLAMSVRDEFEILVEDKVETLRNTPRQLGQPSKLPRCRNSSHSMRYQKLINQMTDPKLLNMEWDTVRDSVYALMWTFHWYEQCLFCWTKSAMPDAIRVSPDFVVDPPSEANHDDLIPDASDTNRRSSTAPW